MRQRKRIGMAPVRIKFLPDEFEVSAPSGLRLIYARRNFPKDGTRREEWRCMDAEIEESGLRISNHGCGVMAKIVICFLSGP